MSYKLNPFSGNLDYYETAKNTVITISADYTLGATNAYFSTVVATAAAEIALPTAVPGMITRIYSTGANTVKAYPVSGGSIVLTGTDQGTDHGLSSPGSAGDFIDLFAKNSLTWVVTNMNGAWTGYAGPNHPWDLTDIAGCVIWLRSDLAWQDAAKTVPCTNSSLIWVGADKSGNVNDGIQATEAKRPIYLTNQINGHPVWRFDSVDDYLKAVAFTLNQPCEVYMVVKIITYDQYGYLFDGDGGNGLGLRQEAPTQIWQYCPGGSGARLDFAAGSWGLIQSLYGNAEVEASKLRLNGGVPTVGNPGASTPGGFTLGAYGADAYYGNIDVAEVVIYEPPLGDTDRLLVENYLNARYAIY